MKLKSQLSFGIQLGRVFVSMVKSHGTECKPRRSDGPCKRAIAKARAGGPIVLSKACPYCNLWRCAEHCDCNVPGKPTYGMRKGRKAGRSARASRSASARVVVETAEQSTSSEEADDVVDPIDALTSVAVRGRPANVSVVVYGPDDQSWRSRAVKEVRSATSLVVVVTYMYDNEEFDAACKRFLKSGRGRTCVVLVDRQMYDDNACKGREKKMLKSLKEAGADVFVGSGFTGQGRLGKHPGSMHVKDLVIDGKVAYSGSANFTEASTKNAERMFRFTGHPVDDIARSLQQYMRSTKVQRLG